MRKIVLIGLFCLSQYAIADTMDHYMHIADQIPQMEMKADLQSQAWARSARSVLMITNESVAETLVKANEEAKTMLRKPFFCLPNNETLDGESLGRLLIKTYHTLSSQQDDKNKLTVSQLAWLALSKTYPCTPTTGLLSVRATGTS